MSFTLTVKDIYELVNTEPPPIEEHYWCGNHDHWGSKDDTCPTCSEPLQDCHNLGINSPYMEWEAAQKAARLLDLRKEISALKKDLIELYDLHI